MKKEFHGYYKPTKSELEKLWKEAIFSFDANVLLNLYTYSPATSKEVLDLIGKYETRIWLPYQVAKEYHKNRIGIIQKEAKRYQEMLETFRETSTQLNKWEK